jgi:drug/metabolite transporter (DMT)-like permease
MIGIVFALLNSLAHAISAVLIRKRIDESNFLSVALVTTIIGTLIVWPPTILLTDLESVNIIGILFFSLAGTLAPGLSRIFLFRSMETIGVTSRIVFSIYPIYSVILGILFLGEILTLENIIGILFVLLGVIIIEIIVKNSKIESKGLFPKKDLILPLFASLVVAFSHFIRKQGLNLYNEQLLGVAIGYSAALIIHLIMFISMPSKNYNALSKNDFKLFWKASIFLSLAWIFAFYALSYEKISIVTPLMQTQPLFILLFAHQYLKECEKISLKLVASSILVVAGIILITM